MPYKVRTRFAPSPTGYLHVGGIRTALFCWLLSRQNKGQFILRLEDTDKKREVPGADEHLMQSLRALGLDFDEGPDVGGTYGPYRQSERLESYRKWAQKLIEKGRAYADPTSEEDLDQLREVAKAAKKPFLYREHRPTRPPQWDGSQPLRLKSDPKPYTWHDEVMGDLSTGPEVVDDFILIKSDGFPTYNFSHIIDDAEMEISHIVRGQEFLASVPNYLNLYEALELDRPKMATVPHILGPGGNKKLSKRDGAKDVLDYVRDGFLPDALVNFIALLGWNDGTDQEIYSRDELIQKFRLNQVQRSGARFDEQRLIWMNGHYIRHKPIDTLHELSKDFWPPPAKDSPDEYKKRILALVQERLKYLAEIPKLTNFFFEDLPADIELINSDKVLGKLEKPLLRELLVKSRGAIESSDFSLDHLNSTLNSLLEQTSQRPAVLFSLIRIATTWAPASPGLADTVNLLGKDKCLQRIDKAIVLLEK
ncbi:glutamate--tRNA ligase [Candidatus Saccharibacteria bacterium RIFCSPHIGHO2_12_FULL_49_19]|nr:MAG: glutamate--tRNA ligase [Candidatus Saccharibacteria bacterium RIFCSPHIGHO2_01_FULL_49_21]OGL36258.1 MAG: glutamate--tRNA ligase [Candidatus Saccharibacteria bacterium RIFCSPHIGHO2_12_FULL_49_19]OGL37337.1 MAG: glutamate--tRNA ligase [Candidatus Saccharibacteria bacterium RIFCSPLOWO2_01_FULL_49_22]